MTPHTHSPDNSAYRMAREDFLTHGRILMITQAILEARGVDVGELEARLRETLVHRL